VAYENRAVVQCGKLSLDRGFPDGVDRVVFIRHPRIADPVTRPELSSEALDQLAVPLIVDARTTSLHEEQLTTHGHTSYFDGRRKMYKVKI
jgi:hypothetical protein